MNPKADVRNNERIIIVKLIVALTVISLVSSTLLSYPLKLDGSSPVNHAVYAVGESKPISIKLNYAHFAPLTNNSKSHQVKVIVLYSVMPSASTINMAQNAMMKVFALNGTLLKTTSFPGGLKINATGGKAQLATTLTDSRIKNITASVMFTDSSKSANFSNPLNVKLNLGQTIQP
ncbi:MAG: hypothetical protein WA395_00075 [Nitrososphaeraceae archaeon]|jgi:flagellar basal body-associated protein FliL